MTTLFPSARRALNEYRCTRNKPYPPGSVGHDNTRARQGHYVTATSEEEALLAMVDKFPEDMVGVAHALDAFTVTFWRRAP